MVNCNPSVRYKPFEWGLFLIIVLSIFVVTISSIFNRAASFNGFYVRINYIIVAIFNLVLLVSGILIYVRWSFFPTFLRVQGSIVGGIAAYITAN